MERHLPMRPARLAVNDLPVASELGNRQPVPQSTGQGPEALIPIAMKAHGRLGERVARAPLARLEGFHAFRAQHLHDVQDAGIDVHGSRTRKTRACP